MPYFPIELSETKWKSIAKNRFYDDPDEASDPIMVEHKSFSFALEFTDIISEPREGWISEISFVDCVFYDTVLLGVPLATRGISFTRCTFHSTVEIDFLAENKINEGCYFKKGLSISHVDTDLVLKNVDIEGQLILNTAPNGRISLTKFNSNHNQNKGSVVLIGRCMVITVTTCNFQKVEFSDCELTEGFLVNSSKISELDTHLLKAPRVSITESHLRRVSLSSYSRVGESVNFVNNTGLDQLSINSSAFDNILIGRCNINILRLSGYQKKDTSTELAEIKVQQLYFDSILNDGSISLRRVTVPNGGEITIRSCNLGKCDFILCDFKNATLDFYSSKLTEVFAAETEFPNNIKTKGKQNHGQAQLAFGQISTAFQKQGDTVRALEYQAREIESHFYQLSYFDKEERKLSFTKVSLWLNKWSNDFGRSWQRGILFSITAGVIFFFALVDSTEEFQFLKPFSYDSDLFIAYLRFMNPLRFFELESIFKIRQEEAFLTLTPWSYFWDFLGRVFVAYGFYQTIQAFRRYGRK